MDRRTNAVGALKACERGVAAIEYAFLLGLIAVGVVASITATGGRVQENWNNVDAAMPGGTNFHP